MDEHPVVDTPSRARLSFRGTVIALTTCFLLVEALCHLRLLPLSAQYAECWSFPFRASALMAGTGTKVAVVGNSAARMGVDADALARELTSSSGRQTAADRFILDGSRVTTWRFILERAFIQPNLRPDAIVIVFQAGALENGGDVIAPVAQGLTTTSDWREVLESHLTDPGERAEFVMDALSATYASRSRLRDKTLNRLIPHYDRFATDMNQTAFDLQRAGRVGPVQRTATYGGLRALLAAARRHNLRLVFALYPEMETDAATRQRNRDALGLVHGAGFETLDLTACPGLTPDRYVDKFHLDPEGQAIFTRVLASALSPLLATKPVERQRSL